MVKNTSDEFLRMFSDFYKKFFNGLADSIDTLSDTQKKFPRYYNSIKEFNLDPSAIDNLLKNLDNEKKGILLDLLLKAGNFSRRTANLFDSTASEKTKLSKDLRQFVEQLDELLKVKK